MGDNTMDIGWLASVVEQCKKAGVAAFVKQDSGPRAGQQGRIPDDLWAVKEYPNTQRVRPDQRVLLPEAT